MIRILTCALTRGYILLFCPKRSAANIPSINRIVEEMRYLYLLNLNVWQFYTEEKHSVNYLWSSLYNFSIFHFIDTYICIEKYRNELVLLQQIMKNQPTPITQKNTQNSINEVTYSMLYIKFNIANMKIGKERGNSYRNNKEIFRWKTHINTWKLNWNVLTITDVFLDQKKVNVCELTVKMTPQWRKTPVIVETFQLSFHVFVCLSTWNIPNMFFC